MPVKLVLIMSENKKTKVALLASGSGTNVQNFINYYRVHSQIEIALVISNNPNAYVLKRIENERIPAVIIENKMWEDENYVLGIFKQYDIGLIVLAGYLALIPSYLIKAFPNKIINIHPALLPKYGGKGMYGMKVHEAVIANKEERSGISVHYVNEEYDKGTIIFQTSIYVSKNDSPESLAKKIQKLEYMHYPRVIEGLV